MKKYVNGLIVLLAYLKKHWFKAALVTILFYMFVQRDFRFSINMNTPTDQESLEVGPNNLTAPKNTKKEVLTDKIKKEHKAVDKFEFPSLFGRSTKYHPINELKKVDDKVKHDYLKRFARVVINERRKYGIPSSIILACGILQSESGQRNIASQGNNHFGLICSLGWEGESGSYGGNCYRHYENAWTSYRDHSIYLTSGKFAQLSTLGSTDYKAWATGLEQLDYGNGIDDLANHLTNIIETYGLDELDRR